MTVTSSDKNNTSTAVTWTMASLATDTNLLVGRTSNAVDNTSNLYCDYALYWKVRTGTSPTASKQVELWAAPSEDGTNYAGGNGGSDAAKTHTAETKALLWPVWIIGTANTSDKDYEIVIPSLLALWGSIPRKFSFWSAHNTAVNLNSTGGNHVLTLTGKQWTSV